ncbi:MAG: hypothetical protein H7336_02870 [Bacteriovorax sp.]|nr:hypothetical protein [Bacteriovorax sp.]
MHIIFNLIILICAGMIMSACSTNKENLIKYSTLGELQTKDYVDHLAAAGKDYLNYEDVKTIKLRSATIEFLEMVYERLVSNNQMILNIPEKPTFYIIQHKSPFIFSLPRSQFFFSSALIERYLKSEELFVAAFAAEVIRSQRFIYEKNIMLPLGFYSTEKMIQLIRLKLETKLQVNEWTYFILKRAGYDASAYLNWIQIQNRNTLDFSLFLGDPIGISKEEHLFKNFMAKQGVLSVEKKVNEANSSKDFYKLLNNIVSEK